MMGFIILFLMSITVHAMTERRLREECTALDGSEGDTVRTAMHMGSCYVLSGVGVTQPTTYFESQLLTCRHFSDRTKGHLPWVS